MTEAALDGRTARARAARAERRAHLLATAADLFAREGFHATSIADVVEAAGVARGTFYLYFESKHALFVELLEDLLRELQRSVVGVDLRPGADPVIEQLVATVARVLRTLEEHPALTRIVFREAVGLDEEVDRRIHELYERLHAFVEASLRRGEALGLVRPLDHAVTATCIVGAIRQVVYRYVLADEGPSVDAEAAARAIVAFGLGGVLTAPARGSTTGA